MTPSCRQLVNGAWTAIALATLTIWLFFGSVAFRAPESKTHLSSTSTLATGQSLDLRYAFHR